MDRIKEYVNELNGLKTEATNLINGIKDSESILENAMNSVCEEIKRTYIREAMKLIDAIAQHKIHRIEREWSRIWPTLVQKGWGIVSTAIAFKAEESEWALRLAKPAFKGYHEEETKKTSFKYISEIVKQRIEDQISSMGREEFMKSLKGERAMRKLLHMMLREELNRLDLNNLMSLNDAGYTLQS